MPSYRKNAPMDANAGDITVREKSAVDLQKETTARSTATISSSNPHQQQETTRALLGDGDDNNNNGNNDALRKENLLLRKKIWKLRYASTRPFVIALSGAGSASLVLAYMLNSSILTITGLGLVLWGILILFISPSRYISDKVGNSVAFSVIKSIDNFIVKTGHKGKVVFLYPRSLKGLTQGYIFVPYNDSDVIKELPTDEQIDRENSIFCESPKGLLMYAPSYDLVQLFEDELNVNFATVDLDFVHDYLFDFITDDLKILDEVSIRELDNGMAEVSMVGESAAALCKKVSITTKVGDSLGCPLCSTFALVISKIKGEPVIVEKTVVDEYANTIKTTYRRLAGL